MWKPNGKIGFDDRLVTIILIPVTALLVDTVFFGWRFEGRRALPFKGYLVTLGITAIIWLGNRFILVWARNRYPKFEDVRKRITVQSIIMLMFTLAADNSLGSLFDLVCGNAYKIAFPANDYIDILVNSNAAALFCSFTVIAVYETIYFMNELRNSVIEKEMLKRENLKAQLSALKTQVNPHFLFNNLNTLSSVIPENPEQAVAFVQQLSKVYRHILEVKDEHSILLQDELEVLKAYAFLLQTRFGNNLDISINIPEEKLRKKIVPLSLQILMENAIKHNIVSSDKPLRVEVFTENGRLIVSNNLQKKNQLTETTGIGLDNIRNRYKLLSDRKVEVQESNSNFTVSIPLIEN
jgi:two-component system, LytTR family, sensor kinase